MFIELHDNLLSHWKVRRLARLLNLSKNEIRGMLVSLWLRVLNQASDGNLANWDAIDVAESCDAPQCIEPEKLLETLVETGLIDRDGDSLTIHNWERYSKYLLKAKRKSQWRERKRRQRERERLSRVTSEESPVSHTMSRSEPEPEPEPRSLSVSRSSSEPMSRVTHGSDERDLALADLEREGFQRFGQLGGAMIAVMGRFAPVKRHEWEAVLKTRGRSWRYVAKVLESFREEAAKPAAPKAADKLPEDSIWAEVYAIASGSQRTEHSDPIAQKCIAKRGGARRLGSMNDYEFRRERSEFFDTYAEIASETAH